MLVVWLSYMALPIIMTIAFARNKVHRKMAIWTLVPIAVIAGLVTYFHLPSRNLLSIIWGDFWLGLIYYLVPLIKAYVNDEFDDDSDDWDWDEQESKKKKKKPKKAHNFASFGVILALLFIVGLGGSLHSHMSVKPMWQSIQKDYSKSTEAPTFKRNETPIALAPQTVINRVRKASSDMPNTQYFSISSQVQAQYYKGKPVYVIPVEYNGFWQMMSAKQIPGYFIIDATNQNAVPHFVHKPYVYATSAYFNHDAERQIYRHAPEWLSLGSPQLEINDNGDPYWIETIYKSEPLSHRVNYSRLHVAVMNAQTGSVKLYSIYSMPKFIDEGITTDNANQMNWNFGKYKYGFWNTVFSKSGVMKPTGNGVEDGVTSVFNKDGSISYFTDFTTDKTGSDSALGYSMINARTGRLTFYKTDNIMDSDGAKGNADQDYKAQQWHASMPILYNVNNHPTWVMNILDSTHAIRGYYYLDASDQSIYGAGSNPTNALDAFRQALVNSGATAGNTAGSSVKKMSGTVDRTAIVASQNKVMFMLKNKKTIFTVNTNDYDSANLIRPGDSISFTASILHGKSVGNISKFKDKNLE